MKTSVIRQRVADFLRRYTPFDSFDESDVLDLAGSGRVRFHQAGEYLHKQGSQKGPLIWLVQQGRVELLHETESGPQMRDVLGEGDLLGLEQFAGDGKFLHSARTASDVILYGLSADLFESLVPKYPDLKRFLSAQFSVSGNLGFGRASWLDAPAPPLDFLRERYVPTENAAVATLPSAQLTTRSAVRRMLETQCDRLALLDGSDQVEAALTASDLSLFCNRSPAVLVAALQQATETEVEVLRPLASRMILDALAQPRDVDDCCVLAVALRRALAQSAIRRRSLQGSTWMIGTGARGDTLDLRLSAIATGGDAIDTDFVWPGGASASVSVDEWMSFYTDTISNPLLHDLYSRRELFDIAPLSGDATPVQRLHEHIVAELQKSEVLVPILANDTLANSPPLTFFHGLVLDMDGAQKDTFDIETVALSPLTAAARVFALSKLRLQPASTLQRLENAAKDYPQGSQVLHEAADAYRIAIYYRALAGSAEIHPTVLGKFDQLALKRAFSSIQKLLELTSETFLSA